MRGFFISLEGPEGAGKSTQAHRLAERLASSGLNVWTTREPGGTALGERIRPLVLGGTAVPLEPWTEALLFTAARAQLVAEVILPRLKRGEVIISDRFSDSTLAYQGYGRGLDRETLRSLQEVATAGLEPDLTIFFNLPPEVGLRRIPHSEQDRLDQETIAFHMRVHEGYQALALANPDRWREVDASAEPHLVADAVHDYVKQAMRQAGKWPGVELSA
jgi:dTMP kinase